MNPIHLLVAATLIFAACKSSTKTETTNIHNTIETMASVIQPFEGLEIAPAVYEVIAEKGAEIKLPNGGTINIPSSAFMDKNGNETKGAVKIEWQEFHSLTDIMLSGIPMTYDSAGVQNNFVSGGMFTINANQNGEEIFIRKGKAVDVDLVSTDDTPCYNFYELDEKSGDWKYETTAVGTPIKKEAPAKKEVKKFEKTLIDCEVDFSRFPELKDKNIVAWSALEDLTKGEQNDIKNSISKLSLQKDAGGYYLNFKRKKEDTKLRVEPFLMEDAQAKSTVLKEELEKDFVEIRTYYQDVSNGKIVRSISLDNFGTYNWDCVYRMNDIQPIAATFDFEGDVENPERMTVFYLCAEDNLILNCSSAGQSNFFYSPNKKNALVAISDKNEVFILDDAGFQELRANRGKPRHTFVLESTGLTADSGAEVGDIVRNVF